MPGRPLRLPIPTHILTGALGSGKTTAISELLKQKPEDEHWSLVINEAGAVGVDAALLGSSSSGGASSGGGGVSVRELAGGCMCCALSGVTGVAIAQVVRQTRPDRLLIEPSGLGHPAQLVKILTGAGLGSALALQPIACLVDATLFDSGATSIGAEAGELFHDQVAVAEVLVGSKADLCTPDALSRFLGWARGLEPPKQRVLTCANGRLDPAALGIPAGKAAGTADASVGGSVGGSATAWLTDVATSAGPGSAWLTNSPANDGGALRHKPVHRAASNAPGTCAGGWVFHADDVFDRQRLEQLLHALAACAGRPLLRLKGILRVGPQAHVAANYVAPPQGSASATAAQPQLWEAAHQGVSRLEVIVAAAVGGGRQPVEGTVMGGVDAAGPMPAPATAALLRGAGGDWSALEALVLDCLK